MGVKGSPRFVPGDRVTIRGWEDMKSEYEPLLEDRGIRCPAEYGKETPYCTFYAGRKRLCGKEVVIRETLWLTPYNLYAYKIEDPELCDEYFTETMFEVPGLSDQPELPEIENEDLAAFLSS